MNDPILITAADFATAWSHAVMTLKKHSWDVWNLVVTIKNPTMLNSNAIQALTKFADEHSLVSPSKVQHTIFPNRFYKGSRLNNRERFYKVYNRFYKYTRKQPKSGWGTYFKRMISYRTSNGDEYDQLGSIIDHINNRKVNNGAAHFMVIPQVGKDSNRKMGSPCLNYLTVQVEKINDKRIIHLLAVYRSHDFRERAFGNYWGLCNLLQYVCAETNSLIGSLTCVSSRAYAGGHKTHLYKIAEEILGE